MLILILQAIGGVFGIRTEENPKFHIVFKERPCEIREYQSYIVARTTVEGEFREAQNKAFRILAGYIFGANQRREKISMTAPVQTSSEKIAMTAPVVASQAAGGWTMTFMMPSKYTMEQLPVPDDKRIGFEVVPKKLVAVISYAGLWREKKHLKKAAELKAWIEKQPNYEITAGPFFAGYDPPWTIPFLRRNEAMYELRPK